MKSRFRLIPAVFLVLRRGDEVLLSLRENTGYQDGKYSLVAGHLEGGEVAEDAMVREAKEEAGIEINTKDLKLIHVTHRLGGNPEQERIDLFFECSRWSGEIVNIEPEKCGDLKWFQLSRLPSNMLPHVRLVLQDIQLQKPYASYFHEPEDEQQAAWILLPEVY